MDGKLTTTVFWNDEAKCWVARAGDYPDLRGVGNTSFEALEDLQRQIYDAKKNKTR
jgi:hypothetical protein